MGIRVGDEGVGGVVSRKEARGFGVAFLITQEIFLALPAPELAAAKTRVRLAKEPRSSARDPRVSGTESNGTAPAAWKLPREGGGSRNGAWAVALGGNGLRHGGARRCWSSGGPLRLGFRVFGGRSNRVDELDWRPGSTLKKKHGRFPWEYLTSHPAASNDQSGTEDLTGRLGSWNRQ